MLSRAAYSAWRCKLYKHNLISVSPALHACYCPPFFLSAFVSSFYRTLVSPQSLPVYSSVVPALPVLLLPLLCCSCVRMAVLLLHGIDLGTCSCPLPPLLARSLARSLTPSPARLLAMINCYITQDAAPVRHRLCAATSWCQASPAMVRSSCGVSCWQRHALHQADGRRVARST